jgi:hypothetical protein
MDATTAERSWLRRAVIGLGLYTLIGGVISFGGWVLDLPWLTDWDGDGISIQPNATPCVMLSSLALLFLAHERRRAALAWTVSPR